MSASTRWVSLVLVVNWAALFAIHLIRPMISYRALQLGAGPVEIGLIASAFGALAFIVAVPVGSWVDRSGERPFVLVGCLLIAVAALLDVVAGSIALLIVGQAMLGLGHIALTVASQTLIANRSTLGQLDARFGHLAVTASLAQLMGPAVAGIVAASGLLVVGTAAGGAGNLQFGNVFLVAAVVGVVSAVIAFGLPRPEARPRLPGRRVRPHHEVRQVMDVLRRPTMPQAMLTSIAVLASIDILIAYLPVYGEETGIPVAIVGLLLSVRAGSSLVSRLFLSRLIHTLGRVNAMLTSTIAATIAFLVLPLLGSTALLIGLMVVMGFGLGIAQPMTAAWVAGTSDRQSRGRALSVRLAGNRFGQIAGPSIAGTVAGFAGVAAVFWTMAAALGVASVAMRRAPMQKMPSAVADEAEADPSVG